MRISGPLWIVMAAVLWGTTGAVVSFAPAGTPSAGLATGSLVLGGLLLLATSGRRPPRGSWGAHSGLLLAVGALGVVGFRIAFYAAITRTGVAVATVVALGSVPVFLGLVSAVLMGLRPSKRWVLASAAAVGGCAMLVLSHKGTVGHAAGIGLACVAGLCCAVYSLISWRLVGAGVPSPVVMGALFGGAAVLALPLLVRDGVAWLGDPAALAVLLYLALVPTFLAYRCFGRGLHGTPPLLVGTLMLTEPAVSALLGISVLGERLSAVSWLGLVVLLVAMANLRGPSQSPSDELVGTKSNIPP
ncbi:DMT family transporter [Actinokineospora sp. 24-640]